MICIAGFTHDKVLNLILLDSFLGTKILKDQCFRTTYGARFHAQRLRMTSGRRAVYPLSLLSANPTSSPKTK